MDGVDNPAKSGSLMTVHNPVGYPPKVTAKEGAPRPDSLDGKIVYLVDCRFDDSIELLKQVKAWFEDKMPAVDARIISISNVYLKDDPDTWEKIQADGDAAIVGVGH